tara:strand:- start:383 stop:670 length:288 start_codon:yes stop_codon:yes gene_type:complete
MAAPFIYRRPDRFLYLGLVIYLLTFGWKWLNGISLGDSIQDDNFSFYLVRLPTFNFVAILLTQVIFNQFRCSRLAIILALIMIPSLPIATYLTTQ